MEDLRWEEPREFQELLRLRRLRRRNFWRNARPMLINTALIFSLILIFLAFYYRSDIKLVFEPVKLTTALLLAFSVSFIWRSLERGRKIVVTLGKNKGRYFLSRRGDYERLYLDEVRAYVIEELKEGKYSSRVLIMKTRGEQRLAAIPDGGTESALENLMRELKIPKGKLKD